MKLYDFSLLARSEQTDLLYKDGIYIGKRLLNSHTVLLYQLEGFYVEVIYKKYRCSILNIYAFGSPTGIDAYLDNIDVRDLVKCLNSI